MVIHIRFSARRVYSSITRINFSTYVKVRKENITLDSSNKKAKVLILKKYNNEKIII